jgi:hypothetical protein
MRQIVILSAFALAFAGGGAALAHGRTGSHAEKSAFSAHGRDPFAAPGYGANRAACVPASKKVTYRAPSKKDLLPPCPPKT